MTSFARIHLVLAGLLAATPATAACQFQAPAVQVETKDASLVVQDVRSVIDYTAYPWQTQNEMAPGWSINGLTVAKPQSSALFEGYWNGPCYTPKRVVVTLAFEDPVKVYVADKYPRNSCQWKVVYEHEMHHVDIFRRGKVIYANRMRQVTQAAASQSAARGDTGDAFMASVQKAMDDVMNEFVRALGAAHGAIDTVENYRKTQALCQGPW